MMINSHNDDAATTTCDCEQCRRDDGGYGGGC